MKKIVGFFLPLTVLILTCPAFAQESQSSLKESFLAAESYFLFEEYNEALPLYLKLHRAYPDNNNYNYKIGVCYLKNPYEKSKSIYYLEKAVADINPKFRDNSYKESTAPAEALFFLGNAYLVNNDIRKARESYRKFLRMIDPAVYDTSLVNDQLKSCDVAERLMKKPVDFDVLSLGEFINTRFADINPVLSGDETKMAFVSRLQFYDAVFYVEKINGQWSNSRNIIPELGVDGDVYPTCLSYDGTEMYVYRNDNFAGNLYRTKLIDGKWTPLEKLNDNINTKYWESHASLSNDGKILYFTSNRTGGYGGLDVYMSKKQSDESWGVPINLGAKINTKYNEETPFITADGDKLFFSSYGHYNMGGYDIFMSIKANDSTWANPVNLGYPLNSTDDDIFFNPLKNSAIGYYSVYNEDGFGRHDIYRYIVYSADYPRKYTVTGQLDYEGVTRDKTGINIMVIGSKGDTVANTTPDLTGKFSFSIPEGRYNMIVESKNFERVEQRINVDKTAPGTEIKIPGEIRLKALPETITDEVKKDSELIENVVEQIIIANKDSRVEIPYDAEKGTQVIVNTYNGESLATSDTMTATGRRNQKFILPPDSDADRVIITYTDKDGNIIKKDVKIKREDDVSGIEIGQDTTSAGLVEAFREQLVKESEGNLKKYLLKLDPEKEGIKTMNDLVENLYNAALENGFTKEEVDRLVNDSVTRESLSQSLNKLKINSTGNLGKTIEKLNTDSLNIHTVADLAGYLIENSEKNGYAPEDVIRALARTASGNDSVSVFIKNLYHSTPDSALKEYLTSPEFTAMKFDTPEDVAVFLYNKAGSENFTKEDIIEALSNMISAKDAGKLRNDLASIATGRLKDVLSTLDLEKEGIYTGEELIRYLNENVGKLGYSAEDVNALLGEYSIRQIRNAESLRAGLSQFAKGNLQKLLEDFDINKFNIASDDELISYLKSNASKYGYSASAVDSALVDLAYYGSLDNVIEQMIANSSGSLNRLLRNLDLQKEGINSLEELVMYLNENAEKNGYTQEDVFNMMQKINSKASLISFIEKLKQYASPGLRRLLDSIDIDKAGIFDVNDLIRYLIEQGPQYGYTVEDVLSSLQKMAESGSAQKHTGSTDIKPAGRSLLFSGIVTAGLLLIIFIIILVRRRKKDS